MVDNLNILLNPLYVHYYSVTLTLISTYPQ